MDCLLLTKGIRPVDSESRALLLTAFLMALRDAFASRHRNAGGDYTSDPKAVLWRQWKRPRTRAKRLMQRGLDPELASRSAFNGRGPWWNAGASHMNDAYRAAFFVHLALPSLIGLHRHLNRA